MDMEMVGNYACVRGMNHACKWNGSIRY